MRLINVATLRLSEFYDDDIPPYAILSHTWGKDEEEVGFVDIQNGTVQKPGNGYVKLQGLCEQAKRDGLGFVWIDTCCIDKSSSRELEEAINCMFRWYEKASVCYVYLSDVPPRDNLSCEASEFSSSRWFRRGWTLQELLAPKKLIFYDQTWAFLGTKSTLSKLVWKITGIPRPFLLGSVELKQASVAQRMSWAATRSTKRREDIAYCLLGIFGVNMAMTYGKGDQTFHELQKEIMKKTRDDSILAWGFNLDCASPTYSKATDVVSGGIFATSPADFANCGTIASRELDNTPEHTLEITVDHLRAHLPLFTTLTGETYGLLNCGPKDHPEDVVGIPLGSANSPTPFQEFIRPQGRSSILLPKNESPISSEPVYVRIERENTTTDRRYWFYIDDSANDDLTLIDVHPRPLWNEESAMIATPNASDWSVLQRSLTRFRSKDKRSQDVVVVLEFEARGSRPSARCHVMACARDLDLQHLSNQLSLMRGEAFGKQGASYGRLATSVTVNEELMGKQPWFIVRLATVRSLSETTVDASLELQQVELRLQLVRTLHQQDSLLPDIEKVDRQWRKTKSILEPKSKRLATVEEAMRKLLDERRVLLFETQKGARELEQLTTSLSEARQQQVKLSNRESEIDQLLNEPKHYERNPWLEGMLHGMLETGSTNLDVSDRPDRLGYVHATKESNHTPLLWAAANGRQAVARRLLEEVSVNIESKDDNGRTALSLAAEMGHKAIVKRLLEKGADPRTVAGKKHEAVVELLRDHCARWESRVSPRLSRDGSWEQEVRTRASDTQLADSTRLLPATMPTGGQVHGPEAVEFVKGDAASRMYDDLSITSFDSLERRMRNSISSPDLTKELAQETLLFYSLTGDAKHMVPAATSYWRHLTLDAYIIYEEIYDRCRDHQGEVHYSSFAAQFRAGDVETMAKTWSRLLESGIGDSRQPKGLVMATLYMLHVERFRPAARPVDDDPDGGVPQVRQQLLRAFGNWVKCCCKDECVVEWNFANDTGLHRDGQPRACVLARFIDKGGKLGVFSSGKREEEVRQKTWQAWLHGW